MPQDVTGIIIPEAVAKAKIVVALLIKEWVVIDKKRVMDGPRRDILVLLKNEFMSPQALESEVERINSILFRTESPHQFCIAHELVDRNRITSRFSRLLKLLHKAERGPFRFLICKN